jgi:homeobox-leucine zipper protein
MIIGLQVVSLTEKLQPKEVAGAAISAQKPDPLPDVSALQLSVKAEDRLSSGSGGSAVVDEDGPQLVDSCGSYFPSDNYTGCVAPVDGVQSEEDDRSDDARSYFSDVFAAAEHQQQQEEVSLGWWVWA